MLAENDRINNEFYVDQVVKHILDLGYRAKVFEIDRYIGWGTPSDYELYQKTFEYWNGFYEREKGRVLLVDMSINLEGLVKDTKFNRCLLVGMMIVLKLILMGLFSSDYQDIMFIPFVDTFLSGHNPYDYYYQNHLISSFPYFPFMLLIESVGEG